MGERGGTLWERAGALWPKGDKRSQSADAQSWNNYLGKMQVLFLFFIFFLNDLQGDVLKLLEKSNS